VFERLRLTVKKIFDQWARVGQRADDPLPVVLRPVRQVPVADILTCQKFEIWLNAWVKREVFEAHSPACCNGACAELNEVEPALADENY
jgi:hypothetical protein